MTGGAGTMVDRSKMNCPNCGKLVNFPTDKAGRVARCPGCKESIKLVANLAPPATEIITSDVPEPTNEVIAQAPPSPRNELADAANVQVQPVQDSRLSKFVSDGQTPKVVAKLLSRVDAICTDDEVCEYIAVQHLPGVLSPDAVVLTNRRAIIFRAKKLGGMNMADVPWMHVQNIHISEGIMGASISVTGTNGHTEKIDHLPKKQARCIYRVGQHREQEMIEFRRQRKMEEDRNAAGNVTVNAAIAPGASPAGSTDLASRLQQLKSMLDAGLIDQSEFDAKKAEILSEL